MFRVTNICKISRISEIRRHPTGCGVPSNAIPFNLKGIAFCSYLSYLKKKLSCLRMFDWHQGQKCD